MIRCKVKGDFKYTMGWLDRLRKRDLVSILTKYGDMGVKALSAATPTDTGKTASSWHYDVLVTEYASTIVFKNSNMAEYEYTTKAGQTKTGHIPIALLIQYGHTAYGRGYVQGIDYINPAIRPIFEKMAKEAWREVTAR